MTNSIFGPARQNGVIVEKLDDAIMHWVKHLGAGPFYVIRHVPLDYLTYLGRPSEPDLSIALGNFGDLQIELIEQHNDAPSPWQNFRDIRGSGIHHISAWTHQYDDHLARLADRDLVPNCEGQISGSSRFAYFRADSVDGSAYEVSDLGRANEFGAVHDLVRTASIDWDGSKPIRSLT